MLRSLKTGPFTRPSRQEKPAGFTLIEVIVAMVIIGILAVGAGFALTRAVEGYVFSKQNMEALQEAHAKINRAVIEFSYMTAIDSMTSSSISYTAVDGDGNTIPPDETPSPPPGLTFSYFYYNDDDEPEKIEDMANVQSVQLIKIEMDVTVGGGGSKTFSTWVAPYRLNDSG